MAMYRTELDVDVNYKYFESYMKIKAFLWSGSSDGRTLPCHGRGFGFDPRALRREAFGFIRGEKNGR